MDIEWTLEDFQERIDAYYSSRSDADWTETDESFRKIRYFISAAHMNAGTIFPYVDFILENEALFRTIGAIQAVQAARDLEPIFEKWKLLSDQPTDEAGDYWQANMDEIEAANEWAESTEDLERLLRNFAQEHDEEIGGGPP